MNTVKRVFAAIFISALFLLSMVFAPVFSKEADETITPVDVGIANAVLPKGEQIYWGEEPIEKLSPVREEIVLNGLWKCMPGRNGTEKAPGKLGWGYARVPGSLWDEGWNPFFNGMIVNGKGAQWEGNVGEFNIAWYEREITVPKEWDGSAAELYFQMISTDAEIYVNGNKAGLVGWQDHKCDITPYITPGETATLTVKVLMAAEEKEFEHYMAAGEVSLEKQNLQYKGIVGDVILRKRPVCGHISDLFIETSVQNKTISFTTEFAGVTENQTAEISAYLYNEKGELEKTLTKTQEIYADRPTEIKFEWRDPRLWDYKQPNLYHLNLVVKSKEVDDSYYERFGFREFRVDGKDFLLNEKPIHLRPMAYSAANTIYGIEQGIQGLLDIGCNFIQIWPNNFELRGNSAFIEWVSDVADKKGILLAYTLPRLSNYYISETRTYDETAWEKTAVKQWDTYKNNPSVVMIFGEPNSMAGPTSQNPELIGVRANLEKTHGNDSRFDMGFRWVELCKELDHTRVVTTHHGADVGEVHTLNNYMNALPIQEREEWLSNWAKYGDMPFMAVEFGLPSALNFYRNKDFGDYFYYVSEPWGTEYAAMYQGNAAFKSELLSPQGRAYRDTYQTNFLGGQKYNTMEGISNTLPELQNMISTYIINNYRSWRAWGITGGMLPWDVDTMLRHKTQWWQKDADFIENPVKFYPGMRGPYMPTVRKNYTMPQLSTNSHLTNQNGLDLISVMQPVIAYIAGNSDNFTEKSHNFYSNTLVEKQGIIINDERVDLNYTASWKVTVGGNEIARGGKNGIIKLSEILKFPIQFTTPSVSKKTDAKISLSVQINGKTIVDEFNFRVFPDLTLNAGQNIYVFDPEGTTSAEFEKLGYVLKQWDGEAPSDEIDVLLIGRRAMEQDAPGVIGDFTEQGGKVLIMAQSKDYVQKYMNYRISNQVERNLFIPETMKDNPILSGLDEVDLRNWNGAGTMQPAKEWTDRTDAVNRYGFHWGNTGSVAGYLYEKPHNGPVKPIIEAGFDLAYSPLMELEYGKGIVLACTLDLEGRTQADPVAELIASRLIPYLNGRESRVKKDKTYFLGSDEHKAVLESAGIIFDRVTEIPDDRNSLLILSGNSLPGEGELQAYIEKGNDAVILTLPPSASFMGYSTYEGVYSGSLEIPAANELFRGASYSDFHVRGDMNTVLLNSGDGVYAGGTYGVKQFANGRLVIAQVTPDVFPVDIYTYYKFSRWRSEHLLSIVLTNLGAKTELDGMLFGKENNSEPISITGDWAYRYEQVLPATDSLLTPHEDGGKTVDFEKEDKDLRNWSVTDIPYNETQFDGSVWLRKEIELSSADTLVLHLGYIGNNDICYVNGTVVGQTEGAGTERIYTVDKSLLKAGKNVIALRVFNSHGPGGFLEGSELYYEIGGVSSDISKDWKFNVERQAKMVEAESNKLTDTGNIGEKNGWYTADCDDSRWRVAGNAVGSFEYNPAYRFDGSVWFKKDIQLQKSWIGEDLVLTIDSIGGSDQVYFNGEMIGSTKVEPGDLTRIISRTYYVPGELVIEANTLSVRVFDHAGEGGLNGKSDGIRLIKRSIYEREGNRGTNYYNDYDADQVLGDDPYRFKSW